MLFPNTKTAEDAVQHLARTALAKHLSNLLYGFGHVESNELQWYILA